MAREQEIEKMLRELHESYLKGNEYDEGDPIFYRINYRLQDAFDLTKEGAAQYHDSYHKEKPRRVSEGFCEKCNGIVGIVPIIYGVQESDILVHDEKNRTLATLLASQHPPDFPQALGVLFNDPATPYEVAVHEQAKASRDAGPQTIEALLSTGRTWTVAG